MEWLAAIVMAFTISPLTWTGRYAQPNFHVNKKPHGRPADAGPTPTGRRG